MARARLAVGVVLVLATLVAVLGSTACDSENACSTLCPTGQRFTNDGTCACEPFDAGYCKQWKDCPDAYCPAAVDAGACGEGQEWSTTICGCYPLPARE
jgi:hypothetical protein